VRNRRCAARGGEGVSNPHAAEETGSKRLPNAVARVPHTGARMRRPRWLPENPGESSRDAHQRRHESCV